MSARAKLLVVGLLFVVSVGAYVATPASAVTHSAPASLEPTLAIDNSFFKAIGTTLEKIRDGLRDLKSDLAPEAKLKVEAEIGKIEIQLKGLEELQKSFVELGNSFEKLDPFAVGFLSRELVVSLRSNEDLRGRMEQIRKEADVLAKKGKYYELKGVSRGSGHVRIRLEALSTDGQKVTVNVIEPYERPTSANRDTRVEFDQIIDAAFVANNKLRPGPARLLFYTNADTSTDRNLYFNYKLWRFGEEKAISERDFNPAGDDELSWEQSIELPELPVTSK